MRTRGNSGGGGGHFAVGEINVTAAGDNLVTVTDIVTGENFKPKGAMVSGGASSYWTYLFCDTEKPKYGYGFRSSGTAAYTSYDSDTPNVSYNVQTTQTGINLHVSSGAAWVPVNYKYVAWD